MAEVPAGPILDALGVALDVAENDQVTEVMILAKVSSFGEDGGTGLVIGTSAGLDWISQRGLVSTAQFVLDHCDVGEDD